MVTYRKLVSHLKKTYPKLRVSVRRRRIATFYGTCSILDDRSFRIDISNDLDECGAIQVLIHEWAHAIVWHKKVRNHGPHWARAYSEVYEVYEKWADTPD